MPRQKKTKPALELDLPTSQQFTEACAELTDKQRAFVFNILDGRSTVDAYRLSYDVRDEKAPHLRVDACRVASDPRVARAIDRGVLLGIGSAVATLEDHSAQLRRLREAALTSGNLGAAVQAEQIRGKASGLLRDQLDITARAGDSDLIAAISNGDPELAAALRRKLLGDG